MAVASSIFRSRRRGSSSLDGRSGATCRRGTGIFEPPGAGDLGHECSQPLRDANELDALQPLERPAKELAGVDRQRAAVEERMQR